MQYTTYYDSPIGRLLLAADDQGLTGLWIEGQKYFANYLDPEHEQRDCPAFAKARKWLDDYFAGKEPAFTPPIHMVGTDFQNEVWEILLEIPYGKTTTYGQIAQRIAEKRGLPRMSAQAVGQAVGKNPVSILVPCHRVVGAGGKLTGYASGLEKKVWLLEHEKSAGG